MGCVNSRPDGGKNHVSDQPMTDKAPAHHDEPLSKLPSSSSSKENLKMVVALYDYKGRDDGELSFDKNEKLVIVDDTEPDWWFAFKLASPEKKGFVPMNFLANNVYETDEWV